jgi:hypothetical protein
MQEKETIWSKPIRNGIKHIKKDSCPQVLDYSERVSDIDHFRVMPDSSRRAESDIWPGVQYLCARQNTARDVNRIDVIRSLGHCVGHITWPTTVVKDSRRPVEMWCYKKIG